MLRRHPVLVPFTLLYLVGVACMTLGPQPLDPQQADLLHRLIAREHAALAPRFPAFAAWLTYNHVEYVANIVMFVPMGFFLVLLLGRRRWWLAILIGVASSGFIETAQLFIPGRVSDIRDIESNSLGTVVGVVIALLVTIPAYRRERDRQRIRELEAELVRYRRV
ncbi:MAG: VanZ family protein [Microbacteriaceae bacterium]|nr:VanZ family protein [Microbacteriaceae bacterium]MCL2795413.1 VanZ family protein [Microbacteriaceae bacterium]